MLHALRWIALMSALALALSSCRALVRPAPASTPGASSIRAFVEPDSDHQVVLDTLKQARASIWLETYLLNDREIMDALKTALARGVAVRVILEAQPVEGGTGNKPAIAELRGANLDIRAGNPAYKLTHSKIILVDGRLALVMTLDQTRADFVANREYGIIDTDPGDIAEIKTVLEADWKRVAPTTTDQNLVWSPGDARRKLLEFIDSAKTTLDIQAVEMRDEEIQAHLLTKVKSGTAVRIIMSPPSNGSDVSAPALNQLIRGGANVRMLKSPYIHSTMMVADRARAFVGSHSFSPLSIDSSRELGILVTEQKAVQTLQGTFMGDWEIGKQREAR
jgi:cardiolipin synthase